MVADESGAGESSKSWFNHSGGGSYLGHGRDDSLHSSSPMPLSKPSSKGGETLILYRDWIPVGDRANW